MATVTAAGTKWTHITSHNRKAGNPDLGDIVLETSSGQKRRLVRVVAISRTGEKGDTLLVCEPCEEGLWESFHPFAQHALWKTLRHVDSVN